MLKGALEDILVLDLSRLLPGPYCSMVLADHGARVISIEDPRYANEGSFPQLVNRNKEHIALNLKNENERNFFLKLAVKADIIIEGFRPGVVKKLGVDYEAIKKINPGIIYCSITGFGQSGSYAGRPGHDVNYLAISGVLDLIGPKDVPPSIPGIQIADIAGGSMQAVSGILLALFARTKTGEGQFIDISITDGSIALLYLALNFQQVTGKQAVRSDSILSHHYAFYNTYETKDKKYISIGALEHKFWKNLCVIMEVPEYTELQYDEEKRIEILNFFRDKFKSNTLEYWGDILNDADVCFAPVKSIPEIIADPFFKERNMIIKYKETDGADKETIGIPIKLSKTPGSVRTHPVKFDESRKSIFSEFGFTPE